MIQGHSAPLAIGFQTYRGATGQPWPSSAYEITPDPTPWVNPEGIVYWWEISSLSVLFKEMSTGGPLLRVRIGYIDPTIPSSFTTFIDDYLSVTSPVRDYIRTPTPFLVPPTYQVGCKIEDLLPTDRGSGDGFAVYGVATRKPR